MNWEVRTMGSATSFFNSTIYRKTMARYWPLWALYGVIWAFAIPLNLMASYFNALRWWQDISQAQAVLFDQALGLPGCLELGLCLSLVFGVLAAMAAFGYLYNNRAACTIHALPVRREALFWSNYLAGFSFLLLPQLAAGLMGTVVELALLPSANWGEALSALGTIVLVQSGTALFFFSFAAFCAMFTGHLLALPAFYGILNGLVITVYFLVTSLMDLFFFGYSGMQAETPLVRYLTPVYALEEACREAGIAARICRADSRIQRCYQAADGVLCRAGASSLCELALFRKPAFLIPLPSAKDNHQYWNAKTLADSGAAILLPQSTTTPEVLSQSLGEWLDAPQAMEEAARRLGDFAHPQATAQAIDAIQEVLEAAARRP